MGTAMYIESLTFLLTTWWYECYPWWVEWGLSPIGVCAGLSLVGLGLCREEVYGR
jgi:hypothetical protein